MANKSRKMRPENMVKILIDKNYVENIDHTVEKFVSKIKRAAHTCMGKTKSEIKQKIVPWCNKKCHKAVKEYKRVLCKYRKIQTIENLIQLKNAEPKQEE